MDGEWFFFEWESPETGDLYDVEIFAPANENRPVEGRWRIGKDSPPWWGEWEEIPQEKAYWLWVEQVW